MSDSTERCSKAAYSRRHDVSKTAVSKWQARGWVLLDAAGLVDVAKSDAMLERFRDASDGRARAGGKPKRGQPRRSTRAPAPTDQSTHWGGYQLRDSSLVAHYGGPDFEAVIAGYGFELDDWGALRECRNLLETHLDPDETVSLRLDVLHTLAFPFGPAHPRPPSTAPSSKEST